MMYERLPEMGLDFSVVYPTMGLITIELQDEEPRRASARALNQLKAETFRGFEDRLTPAALIPMHSPGEAIAELEYAARELGSELMGHWKKAQRRGDGPLQSGPDRSWRAA